MWKYPVWVESNTLTKKTEIMGGNSCIKDKRKAGRMIQWCERIDDHKTCHLQHSENRPNCVWFSKRYGPVKIKWKKRKKKKQIQEDNLN